MLKDITLGQYFAGSSPLHRMNPCVKIIVSIMYIVAVFLCKELLSFAFVTAFTVFLIVLSGISPSVILKSIKPLLIILIFTTAYNVFFVKGDTLLFGWKFINIYTDGVFNAIFITLRIVCLLIGTSVVLTYTTSPIMLTDGIEKLLSPLKLLHVDVQMFAVMMSIAIRFIPTLIEETDKIISAQKSRGADLESGNLISRAKALVPIIIPLFASSIRHAVDLSTAMECRCYHGGEGRTRLKENKVSALDIVMLVVFALAVAAAVILNQGAFVPAVFNGVNLS